MHFNNFQLLLMSLFHFVSCCSVIINTKAHSNQMVYSRSITPATPSSTNLNSSSVQYGSTGLSSGSGMNTSSIRYSNNNNYARYTPSASAYTPRSSSSIQPVIQEDRSEYIFIYIYVSLLLYNSQLAFVITFIYVSIFSYLIGVL